MAKKACERKSNKKPDDKVTVKHICSKCGLKASKKKHLCKPANYYCLE